MYICDWSSDVCSSDLLAQGRAASRQQLCQIGPLSRAGSSLELRQLGPQMNSAVLWGPMMAKHPRWLHGSKAVAVALRV